MQPPQQQQQQRRHRLQPRVATFLSSRKLNAAVRRHFAEFPLEEYAHAGSVRVLAATFNVNGRPPPPGLDLSPWLAGASKADIVAIGFQELVALNASNVVMGGNSSGDAARPWLRLIDAALNPRTGQSFSSSSSLDGSSHGSGSVDKGNLTPAAAEAAAGERFALLSGRQMVGVYMCIWARRRLVPCISGLQDLQVHTGILGMFGNKGAVAVRLRVHDTGVAFVSAHLSSGEKPTDEAKRNADYWEVVRRGVFATDDLSVGDPTEARRLRSAWGPSPQGILDMDHAIWVGDLNYRLSGISDEQARKLIAAGNVASLLRCEQLNQARAKGAAFEGWSEGDIRFLPTFKFKRGTDRYLGDLEPVPGATSVGSSSAASSIQAGLDQLALTAQGASNGTAGRLPGTHGISAAALVAALDASQRGVTGQPMSSQQQQPEKVRTPAWCDRVLYRTHHDASAPGCPGQMTLVGYESAPVRASDHRPVWALLEVPVLQFDDDLMEAVLAKAIHAADLAEMAAHPRCQVEQPALDLGVLRYGRPTTLGVRVANVGGVPASVTFVPQPRAMFGEAGEGEALYPSWATPSLPDFDVPPQGVAELHLTALINGGRGETTVEYVMTQGKGKLDAILVLRVEEGNDMFVSLSGSYAPSFFGLEPDALVALSRPLVPSCTAAAGAGGRQPAAPASVANEVPPLIDLDGDEGAGPGAVVSTSGMQQQGGAVGVGPERADSWSAVAPGAGGLTPEEVAQLVPPELRSLAAFLRSGGRLATPGLFTASTAALGDEVSVAVDTIREALDEGLGVPSGSSPHAAAATLLAYFASLPRGLLPKGIAAFADTALIVEVSTASVLLKATLGPAARATLWHTVGLLREALSRAVAAANGLSARVLASMLAELWFDPLSGPGSPVRRSTSGSGKGQAWGAAVSEGAATEQLAKRTEFLAALIEGNDPLCNATAQHGKASVVAAVHATT